MPEQEPVMSPDEPPARTPPRRTPPPSRQQTAAYEPLEEENEWLEEPGSCPAGRGGACSARSRSHCSAC